MYPLRLPESEIGSLFPHTAAARKRTVRDCYLWHNLRSKGQHQSHYNLRQMIDTSTWLLNPLQGSVHSVRDRCGVLR